MARGFPFNRKKKSGGAEPEDELAARLQLKEGTARVRAHRLLTKLRERFLAALEGGTATGFDKTE